MACRSRCSAIVTVYTVIKQTRKKQALSQTLTNTTAIHMINVVEG